MKAISNYAVLAIGLIATYVKLSLPRLLPYGTSQINHDRPVFSDIDKSIKTMGSNNKNNNLVKIYERVKEGSEPLLIGPETIVFDDESNMYAFAHGNVLKLTNFSEKHDHLSETIILADVHIVATSPGCPLGGKFVPGTKILYFADVLLGLCRLDLSQPIPKIELIASKVQLEDGTSSQILYADDVDISKSGMVYFSDATNIPPDRDGTALDVVYGYKMDLMRGIRTGRLLRYDPSTDKVDILAENIWFANGIAVDKEEKFVMVSESSMARILKYHLTGPKKGQIEVMIDKLPGFVDGADCSSSSKRLCYSPIPSSILPIVKLLNGLPASWEAWIKTLLMMLPKSLTPKPTQYGGVIEIVPGDDSSPSHISRLFQDPNGDHINMITGVTELDGKLYLGTLTNNYVGVLDLEL
mmetsp:Transcript_6871/g.7496  ORF Transcript_6871/g.7496 Transcript_6871/m.7496 type:complete len:412 (+) Transcript_6871:66-1301(+)